ncbi:hypothetical protein GCM10011394_19390 [Luteimonas terricola]|uniref:Uncharacterized protein n=2 Tax=Luteimonas terricola TaxID=645597 RepID=A0ABQ2EFH4_9GAMM|nr:hypothetical protein GCM10011394_19390 [Luteimonas terricola]
MEAIAARTVALWTEVARVLVPIIGQRGMSALYERALHLAAAQHRWLGQARGEDGELPVFSSLARAASEQAVDDAIASVTTLFETFDRLLVTLIGASLTERLLKPIWDVPSAGPIRQDTAP